MYVLNLNTCVQAPVSVSPQCLYIPPVVLLVEFSTAPPPPPDWMGMIT